MFVLIFSIYKFINKFLSLSYYAETFLLYTYLFLYLLSSIISSISFLLLSEFLPLYLITNISPPFCHQCQRTIYKYNNYKVTPKWDRKSWCTFKIVAKVLSHESYKIWHEERAIWTSADSCIMWSAIEKFWS